MPGTTPDRDDWIEVGQLDDIPRRGARRVRAAGVALPIAVFRTAEDAIFALIDRCPHKAGPLSEGIVQGCAVACPLHGWVIHLDSGEAKAPDEGRSPVVPARLAGSAIWLSLTHLRAAVRDAA
ncbi:MAG: Rieske 2Fe-2S domain-containing protein [Alphaproteobacteria bacterium]|nr:Rieske 2Fe-2S domain-containing protein [Alphaproteobacteria bacterium]